MTTNNTATKETAQANIETLTGLYPKLSGLQTEIASYVAKATYPDYAAEKMIDIESNLDNIVSILSNMMAKEITFTNYYEEKELHL